MGNKMEILQKKIKEYGMSCQSAKTATECEALRKEFVKRFPIEKLGQLTLEQYALGTEYYKDSFCYWLETKLDGLGNIHSVAGSTKFGVYYGKLKPDMTNKWRWTKWTNEDFSSIREEIVTLLNSGKDKDLVSIQENRLSPMLKGKILACYFPNDYGNVFSYEHIKFFLQNVFGIYSYPNQFEAQELLLQCKNANSVMRKWTNFKFSAFLYTAYPEVKIKEKEEINEDTPQIIGRELIPIMPSGQYYEIPKKETSENQITKHPKADYEAIAKHNSSVGKAGEQAVFDYEKKRLKDCGKVELAEKVEWISLETDSYGYDIKSYNEDGSERHIEVKTNTGTGAVVSFYISAFEYFMLRTDPLYEIFYVFGKNKRKVYHVDCSQLRDKFELLATPVSYKVDFVTEDTK